MDRNERQLIQDLFVRLRCAESQIRDPEAERLIADEVRAAPNAPYTMAQIILAQNQALENAARQIEELEASGAGAQQEPNAPWGAPGMGAASGPRGSVPAFGGRPGLRQGAGFGQGGGFLANAGQMALGVAGGMLIGEAAKSLLGGGSEAQAATPDAASTAGSPLADQAGANDIAGTDNAESGGEGGGGGLFGWLFGGSEQEQGAGDEQDMADSGWDDDGGGFE